MSRKNNAEKHSTTSGHRGGAHVAKSGKDPAARFWRILGSVFLGALALYILISFR